MHVTRLVVLVLLPVIYHLVRFCFFRLAFRFLILLPFLLLFLVLTCGDVQPHDSLGNLGKHPTAICSNL